tara:strand:- start:4507 stop:5421 length:915 start_codon:yes stop_codon:yes gene_type:complete
MTTIESRHQYHMDSLQEENDQVEYLLDVAEILEKYGNDNIETVEKRETGQLKEFVQITGNQNKGMLYKHYMAKVENQPIDEIIQINSYECEHCKIEKLALGNDSHMICPNCGQSDIYFDSGTQGMSYDQEVNSEVNISFAYKRINHFNEWLAQFQAKESTHIPQSILDEVKKEFKKQRLEKKDITQSKVKLFLKKLGYNKFYEHVPHITNLLNGIKPPSMHSALEETLRNMFRDIQVSFEKNKPKQRSNFLSYSYCLYKFCELLNEDKYLICFPLLKSREKLYAQDCIWKKICIDMNYEFIPTI